MSTLDAVYVGITLLVMAPIFYAIGSVAWRAFHTDARLRMREAMRGLRIPVRPPAGELETLQRARAVRRCVGCLRHVRCDEALAAKDWRALRALCPNTAYFDSLSR